MFARVAVWLGKAAVVVFALVGVVVLLMVWQLAVLFGGWAKQEKKAEPVPVVQVKKVEQLAQAVASPAECACLSGAMCEGPRGGKYCVTEGGEKVYRTKK